MNLSQIIDFKNLFSASRLFETTPSFQGHYLYLAIFFGLCLILSIYIGLIRRKNRGVVKRIYNQIFYLLLIQGLLGLFLIAMRYEQIPYLGSRFLVFILVLIMALWLVKIIIYRYTALPRELRKKAEKEKFEKFLPKNYISKKINKKK